MSEARHIYTYLLSQSMEKYKSRGNVFYSNSDYVPNEKMSSSLILLGRLKK
jgi:hypothetical protein